ncbi:type 1 glutamine amidotransferase family protein [Leptospira terpstrae]|nr:hypothetical protein [Leptospira terpstrae]
MSNPTWILNKLLLQLIKVKQNLIKILFVSRMINLQMFVFLGFVLLQTPIFGLPKPKVLIVMSAADTILLDENHKHPTGVFANELMHPVIALENTGIELVFATPGAKRATLDPESLKDKYWNSKEEKAEAIQFLNSNTSFLNPISLEVAVKDQNKFVAILIPGGLSVLVHPLQFCLNTYFT